MTILAKEQIIVGGLLPITTIDFPGKLAAVIFCQGCQWGCPYCHNAHLRPLQSNGKYKWADIITFLKQRKDWLDAVVFSGGEPILQENLSTAINEVKELGFLVGLHTSGYRHESFRKILPQVDWVGLDIKTTLNTKYDLITRQTNSYEEVLLSLNLLINSGKDYELRLTKAPNIVSDEDVLEVKTFLKTIGAKPLKIQQFIERK
jgi:pyruvate formate lyase activating enzyme